MSDISLVGPMTGERAEAVAPERSIPTPSPNAQNSTRLSDRAEFSDHARFMSRLAALPPVRSDLVSSIRDQIANGTYETSDRLDQAIESLLEDHDVQN